MLPSDAEELSVTKTQYEVFEARRPRRLLPANAVKTSASVGKTQVAAGAFDIVTGDVERLGGRPRKPLRDVLAGALKSPSA
jgi:hypothetical protein